MCRPFRDEVGLLCVCYLVSVYAYRLLILSQNYIG